LLGYKAKRFEINLIISYAVIIAMIALVIGVAYTFYFLNEYTGEVVAVNNQKIESISELLHKMLVMSAEYTVTAISGTGASNSELQTIIKFPELVDAVTIKRAYDFLGDLVNQRMDVLHHIDVYMPSQKMLVSSLYGSKSLESQGGGITLEWLENACKSTAKRKWSEISEDTLYSGSPELLVYMQGMALASDLANSRAIFVIYFKKDAISKIMQQGSLNNILLDNEQNILMGGAINQRIPIDEAAKFIRGNSMSARNKINKASIDGKDYIVSEASILASGLTLYNFWPFDLIKIRQTQMLSIFSLVLGVIIMLGSLLSYLFFKGLSKPLVLLSENSQIIKKNILLDAVNKRLSHKEANLRLGIIGKQLPYAYFGVVLIDFAELQQTSDYKMHQVVLFDFIEKLEKYNVPQTLCIAADTGETGIFVLVNSVKEDISEFIDYAQKMLNKHANNVICYAGATNEIYHLSALYDSCHIMKKFAYFFPKQGVIKDVNLTQREESREEFPLALILNFQTALAKHNTSEMEEAFGVIKNEMQTGDYSYNVCQNALMFIANELSKFLIHNGIKSSEVIDDTMLSDFSKIKNIDAFSDWVFSVYAGAMNIVRTRNDKRNDTLIERACLFVDKNLSQGVGVAEIADHVELNAQYFGRLFREAMGISARDYVSMKQIEKAAFLLKTTSLNIKDIADSCGFGSGNYLIKKFKKAYGVTPNSYRTSQKANTRNSL